jgi:hypothetical protein
MIAFDTHGFRLNWDDAEEVQQLWQLVDYCASQGQTNTVYRGRYA